MMNQVKFFPKASCPGQIVLRHRQMDRHSKKAMVHCSRRSSSSIASTSTTFLVNVLIARHSMPPAPRPCVPSSSLESFRCPDPLPHSRSLTLLTEGSQWSSPTCSLIFEIPPLVASSPLLIPSPLAPLLVL